MAAHSFATAWKAFLQLPPLKMTMYATGSSVAAGGVLLAIGDLLRPGAAAQLEQSRAEASRIPRLRANMQEQEALARRQREALRAMIEDTKTKTFSEKISTASSALHSFHLPVGAAAAPKAARTKVEADVGLPANFFYSRKMTPAE